MPRAIALIASVLVLFAGTARAQEEAPSPPHQVWSFNGVFGTYDRAALQRGFQVYKEVCAACHPVKHLAFRDLAEIGYSEDEVKGIAAQVQVTDGPNDNGEMFQRPGRASDPMPGPFANDQAARAANNGALPPDHAPAAMKMNPNMNYNEYFAGHQIAMPPPLNPDQVKFADGTPATVPQMAHDVVTFLSWAAEPTLEQRHRIGFKVILFLIIATGVFYAAKRKVWSRVH